MARLLYSAGYEIYAADSTYATVCILSRFVNKFIKLPAPTCPDYKNDLCKVLRDYKIDILIPTCEEIFYISQFKSELEKYSYVFCDTHEKLIYLHDKWSFYNYLKQANILTPVTQLADKTACKWKENKIIKPRFSRFASKIIFSNKIPSDKVNKKYLVQEFVKGQQICSYALVKDGKIISQCVYKPVLTAGKGAGILMKRISHTQAEKITEKISKNFNFTGQIAFDFIETQNGDLYTIECNPRTTSGLGFIGRDLLKLLLKNDNLKIKSPSAIVSCLGVLSYAISQPIKTIRARKILFTATDFISIKQDSLAWFAQIPIVIWWFLKGLFFGGPTAASTADIEFNGGPF
ncbi:MAG: ATP-grasp domain-containing protein [Elusimicrobiaceae bacterium]|nr:ATP-grasp domain-containing protein [Elusimicrobiaceae bacterium]